MSFKGSIWGIAQATVGILVESQFYGQRRAAKDSYPIHM